MDEADRWLQRPVIVEEKLDGANVTIWRESANSIQVASRGGAGAMDRAGQLGRLRAWVGERSDALQPLLAGGWVLYGEWLWLRHGTAYDALPDWLVVLDLWQEGLGFAAPHDRDRRVDAVQLTVPPRVYTGILGDRRRLEQLLGPSALAVDAQMEGLVLRSRDDRRCKVVNAVYKRRTDEQWQFRAYNSLADRRRGRGSTSPAGGVVRGAG